MQSLEELIFITFCINRSKLSFLCFKGERNKFLKNCQLTFYAVVFGHRTSFSIIKLDFREKHEFYLFSNNVIFKDPYYLNRLSRALKFTSL